MPACTPQRALDIRRYVAGLGTYEERCEIEDHEAKCVACRDAVGEAVDLELAATTEEEEVIGA